MFEQQRVRAEAALSTYEEAVARLFRDEARRVKIFGDEEHERQVDALRQARADTVDGVLAEVRGAVAEARKEFADFENGDPTSLLVPDELAAAAARKPFVDDIVWGTSETALEDKLRAVLDSGDRPAIFAYWRAALSRHGAEDRAKAAVGDTTGGPLPGVLEEMCRFLAGPARLARVERAGATEDAAVGAELRISPYKGGARSQAELYANRLHERVSAS